jgi:hypothetical protein
VASADPAETARGYIHDFHQGALKLVGDRERGVLIGATLVSPIEALVPSGGSST